MFDAKHLLGIVAVGLLVAPLLPATAAAEERVCRGAIGAKTVDNLRVPQRARCVLNRTHVKGTIKVESNAVLRAKKVRVIGNVQAENARRVNVVRNSRVGGSVQIVQGRAAKIAASNINADILFDENAGALVAARNQIGGNLQAFQNSGGVKIRRNVIDGNLQCKENQPRPVGAGNRVEGNKEDQCARL